MQALLTDKIKPQAVQRQKIDESRAANTLTDMGLVANILRMLDESGCCSPQVCCPLLSLSHPAAVAMLQHSVPLQGAIFMLCVACPNEIVSDAAVGLGGDL